MPLTQFLSAQLQDYLRPNLFSVYFNFDAPFKIEYGSVLVRTSQLPGQTINSAYSLYNNRKNNFATTLDLDDVSMDIYCDSANKAHSFMLYWQSKVISPVTRVQNFKNDYAGSVEIIQHTRPLLIAGYEAVNAKLINAWPTNVSPIELSADSENDICRFSVTFKFDDVEYTFKNGIISSLLSFGAAGAGLAGLI